MVDNDDEILFDEDKARKLVYLLLSNDIVNKKLIPEIKALNSEAFEKLFQGIQFKTNENDEDGYNYNVKNKKAFKKLLNKFDNFYVILDAWYKDKKYYQYLNKLWSKYISIENLICNDDKETVNKIEMILKQNEIDYPSWPNDIKNEFLILVKSTEDTRIMELKKEIDNKFSEFNTIIDELILFQNKCKDKPDIKNYEINTNNMITTVLGTIMLPIALASSEGLEAIDIKQIKSVKRLLVDEDIEDKFSPEKISYYVDKFARKIKGESGTKIHNLKFEQTFRESNYNFYRGKLEAEVRCTNGKIDNLNISQKAKAFLKNKWVCGLHMILSFLNLAWSVYELTQTYKGFKVVKEYEKELNEIRTSFNIHKNEIGILPDDFTEARIKIMEVKDKIREDQLRLRKLIEKIMKSIASQESQKTKAKAQFVGSLALGVFGAIGGITTCNGTAVIYGISTVANVISAVSSGTNIIMSEKILKTLRDLLEKAFDLNKEIEDEIEALITELNSRIDEQPKFDLSRSNTSVSTNLSNE